MRHVLQEKYINNFINPNLSEPCGNILEMGTLHKENNRSW